MGIIRVGIDTVKSTLSDQYLESIVPFTMDAQTIMTPGVVQPTGKRKAKPSQVITDGSLIQVGENQTMLLVDGGKIIDYTAEAGYFEVRNDSAPSLLNGQFGDVLQDAFRRFKFGGGSPSNQQVYYINTQEIRDIPFGTQNPINYFDTFYNAELYIRSFGYYSIRVTNPLLFYGEMAPRNSGRVTIEDLQRFALSEFLTAFQTAVGKMSVAGERISHLPSKTTELAQHMQQVLDQDWEQRRGFRIESVGISSISYDEQSKKLIDMRNQGAMLSDGGIRDGYVAGAAARGMEAAGSNPSGAGMGALGMGMMGRLADDVMPKTDKGQPAPTPAPTMAGGEVWNCAQCGTQNTGGNFCTNCGAARPKGPKHCANCGTALAPDAKFCNQCGHKV